MPEERLQKILSQAGVASRRQAEKIMLEGRVTVNGTVVTELGTKANLESDHIKVDGKLLRGPERHTYIVLNKPKGYVTTARDPERRPTVMDLLRGIRTRVYPVGRLDYASEGLLLLSNGDQTSSRADFCFPKCFQCPVPKTRAATITPAARPLGEAPIPCIVAMAPRARL